MMRLAGVDLNLPVALDALLAERNITRAAGRIGRTQPAMSQALNRLRIVFEDELLVRGARGLELTAKALELQPEIVGVLSG